MIMLHTLDRIVNMLQAQDASPVSYDSKSIIARLKPVVDKCTFNMDGVFAITTALFDGEFITENPSSSGVYGFIRKSSACYAKLTYFYIGISDGTDGSFQLSPAKGTLQRKWSDYENKFSNFESLIKILLFQVVGRLSRSDVDDIWNQLRA